MAKKITWLILLILLSISALAEVKIDSFSPAEGAILINNTVTFAVTTNETANCSLGISETSLEPFNNTNSTLHNHTLLLGNGQQQYLISCGNTSAAKKTISFTVDTTPPLLLSISPAMITANYTDFTIVTSEAATCKYSRENLTFSQMDSFQTTGGTSHSSTIYQLVKGDNILYIKCFDQAGLMGEFTSKIVVDQTPPTAEIKLSNPSPVKEGNLGINLVASEALSTVSLSYKIGEDTNSLKLTKVDDKTWTTTLEIKNSYHNKSGSFTFSGKDLLQNAGTEITAGKTFSIDTEEPGKPLLNITPITSGIRLIIYLNGEIDHFKIYQSKIPTFNEDDFVEDITDYYYESEVDYYYWVRGVDDAGNLGDLSDYAYLSGSNLVGAGSSANESNSTIDVEVSLETKDKKIKQIKDSITDLSEQLKDLEFADDYGPLNPVKTIRHYQLDIRNLENSLEGVEDYSESEVDDKIKEARERIAEIKANTPQEIKQNKDRVIIGRINDQVDALVKTIFKEKKINLSEEERQEFINGLESEELNLKAQIYEITYLDGEEVDKMLVSHPIQKSLFMEIPKSLAQDIGEIEFFNPDYEVILEDPLIRWVENGEASYLLEGGDISDLKDMRFVSIPNLDELSKKSSSSNKLTGAAVENAFEDFDIYNGLIALGVLLVIGIVIYLLVSNRKGKQGSKILSTAKAAKTKKTSISKRAKKTKNLKIDVPKESWFSSLHRKVTAFLTPKPKSMNQDYLLENVLQDSKGGDVPYLQQAQKEYKQFGLTPLKEYGFSSWLRQAHQHIDNLNFTQANHLYCQINAQDMSKISRENKMQVQREVFLLYDKLCLYIKMNQANQCIQNRDFLNLKYLLNEVAGLYNKVREGDKQSADTQLLSQARDSHDRFARSLISNK